MPEIWALTILIVSIFGLQEIAFAIVESAWAVSKILTFKIEMLLLSFFLLNEVLNVVKSLITRCKLKTKTYFVSFLSHVSQSLCFTRFYLFLKNRMLRTHGFRGFGGYFTINIFNMDTNEPNLFCSNDIFQVKKKTHTHSHSRIIKVYDQLQSIVVSRPSSIYIY